MVVVAVVRRQRRLRGKQTVGRMSGSCKAGCKSRVKSLCKESGLCFAHVLGVTCSGGKEVSQCRMRRHWSKSSEAVRKPAHFSWSG